MKKHILYPLTAIALLALCLVFSCKDQDAPYNTAPTLTVGTATVSGRTTATLTGSITFSGTTEVDECGFIYSTVSTLSELESTTVPVSTSLLPGEISVELTGLEPNTHYYYCLYASSGYTELRSDIRGFDTAADGLPVYSDVVCSDITETTATVSSELTDNGGYNILSQGFSYSLLEEDGSAGSTELTINVDTTFKAMTVTLTDLQPGCTYSVYAFGTNQKGVGSTESVEFTTKAATVPILSAITATDSTNVSIGVQASVTNEGASEVTEIGFCWSSESQTPDTTGLHGTCNDQLGEAAFSMQIERLSANTAYYIRAYAINTYGVGYGATYVYNTKQSVMPEVSTGSATDVTESTAQLNGRVDYNGGADITTKGFYYSTDANVLLQGNGTRTYSGAEGDTIICTLEGLSMGTTYYYCAYAENERGISRGEVMSFLSSGERTAPTVQSGEATNITETSARLSGNVTSDGGSTVIAQGFYWGTGSNPAEEGIRVAATTESTAFACELSGLTAGTTYYYCAYAENAVGTSHGDVLHFSTLEQTSVPTVGATTVSGVSETGATLAAGVTSDGGLTITGKGFYYSSTNASPTAADNTVTSTESGTDISATLSGLTPNTTYYVCAYATNAKGTSTGAVTQFTTASDSTTPTVETGEVASVTESSATFTGTVTDDGGGTVTATGFYYGLTANPESDGTRVTATAGSDGTFTRSVTGLTASTHYYVCAFAENEAGTSYGTVREFTTNSGSTTPTVATGEVTDVTESSATFTGTVTDDGGATVTATGFYYGLTTNPESSGTRVTATAGDDGTFTAGVTGLTSSTHYYVRAFAENEAGISYGTARDFTTGTTLSVPAVSSTSVTDITTGTATATATVVSDGGAEVTAKGFYYGTNNPPTAADMTFLLTDTGSDITASLTGLEANTRYYIRAFATNSQGTAEGSINVFTTQSDITTPTVGSVTASDTTSTSVHLLATILDNGNAEITEKGFCYTTSASTAPTVDDSKAVDTATGDDITLTLTGLSANTVYYIRAYATNSSNRTGYSDTITVRTTASNVPSIDDNPSPDR